MSRNPRNQTYPAVEDLPGAGGGGPLTRIWRVRSELMVLGALGLLVLAGDDHAHPVGTDPAGALDHPVGTPVRPLLDAAAVRL